MTSIEISRNVHVKNHKKEKLADDPVVGTFTYDFPETVEEYQTMIADSDRWEDNFLVRLANHGLLGFLQARISSGLQKGTLNGTKNATVEVSDKALAEIQAGVTAYVPFQTKRLATKRESNRTLRKNFEEKGDNASALAMFDGQLEQVREAVRRDPSRATDPELQAYYKGMDAALVSYGLRPLSEELLEIAAEAEAEA